MNQADMDHQPFGRLERLIMGVWQTGEPLEVTRDGKVVAVIVNPDELAHMRETLDNPR
jgi:PHD/YefM family antitoxin component YafN of YafNO toxin-antitoxin module